MAFLQPLILSLSFCFRQFEVAVVSARILHVELFNDNDQATAKSNAKAEQVLTDAIPPRLEQQEPGTSHGALYVARLVTLDLTLGQQAPSWRRASALSY